MVRKTRAKKPNPIRYAVVGLGYISQAAVLPAFRHAKKNSTLAALVSDDPMKLKSLGKKYGVKRLYSYDEYEDCLKSGEVDAVYIALPNSQHCEYTVRAARHGVHVLCEKPMGLNVAECNQMIDACAEAGVKLMVAYRLHFERANLKAVEIARSGKLGDLKCFLGSFSMQVEAGNIRLRKDLGGGPLLDLGIYCINAARYLFRAEPLEVGAFTANSGDRRFREVEEAAGAWMRFPGERTAFFHCGFGAADTSFYRLVGSKGQLRVEPAYELAEGLTHYLTIGQRTRVRHFPKRDQFGPELLYFSDCVRKDREPEPSGVEGLADVRVIEAIYESAESGKALRLSDLVKTKRPVPSQEIHCPPFEKPSLVRASAPH